MFVSWITDLEERFVLACNQYIERESPGDDPIEYGDDEYWDDKAREHVACQMLNNVFKT